MKRTAFLVVVAVLLTFSLAIAGQEKETSEEAKPITTGCVSVPGAGGQYCRIWDFDSQVAEWMKGVPQGALITITPEDLQADPSKECVLFYSVGDDIKNHVVHPFPPDGVSFKAHRGVNPIYVYATLKEGYRRDTSYLKSKSGLLKILSIIPVIGDLGSGKITANVLSSARYSFQSVPVPANWPRSPIWAARFMAHMGAGGAAAMDLSATAEEIAAIRQVMFRGSTSTASEGPTGPTEAEVEAVKARNCEKLKQYEQDMATWRAECAAAQPKKETRVTGQRTVVRKSVVRFFERYGESCYLSDYTGPFSILSGGEQVASGQASGGQGTFVWWCDGAEISVKYGSALEYSTRPSIPNELGIVAVCWQANRRNPDAPRRSISAQDILDLLRSGRRDSIDKVLRVLGTSACEVEAELNARPWRYEIRPARPLEKFEIAYGLSPHKEGWKPSSESPAIWIFPDEVRTYVIQIIQNCGNFVAGLYCPPAKLLQPDICTEDVCKEFTTPAVLPKEPTKPTLEPLPKPCAPKLVPQPFVWQGQVSGLRGMDASQRVSIPQVHSEWNLLLPFFMRQSQTQSQWQTVVINGVPTPVFCPPVGSTPDAFPAPEPPAGFSGGDK